MPTLQNAVKIHGENVGRSMRKAYQEASDPSWEDTGQHFHLQMRSDRFTHRHATEAGYEKRSAKYTREKFRKFGHTYPLKKTGEAENLSRFARIKSRGGTGTEANKGGVAITYPHLNKLNFRNSHSNIDMRDEFTRITQRETNKLGHYFAARFSPRFNSGAK